MLYNEHKFWIEPESPYFCFRGGRQKFDPALLYRPPPDCGGKLHSDGFNCDPIARQIVDIDRQLADLLRPCFQSAMGLERLHDLLQELHHFRSGVSQSHPPFSNFDDPLGYAGYVPSATYLRMIYTAIVDQLRLFMDKEMMVLDGVVLKGDHTFKIIKHMAKVDRESTFYALYTVYNEFEEISIQLLVSTKKLHNIAGDKRFLQETIPSLNQPLSATLQLQLHHHHHHHHPQQ
ncbi:hypothetical protein INT45_013259 [Circinella minor]|uniref:Uncharacterized protein n=1 Tax=Circinella minor TaxID=1195481 RepID=A0A8H7S5M9_9FUNG|nr:hypothetical protein INT45_013259 [Circinella minor]